MVDGVIKNRTWLKWLCIHACTHTVTLLFHVLEKSLENPLDCKEIKPINSKGNQSWIFFGRTDAEAEASILWPPDVKSLIVGKDPDSGKDQGQKREAEDEMVGWHYQLDGHEFEQALGVDDWQRSLAFCSPSGHKESDMTKRLNNIQLSPPCLRIH